MNLRKDLEQKRAQSVQAKNFDRASHIHQLQLQQMEEYVFLQSLISSST